MKFEADIAGLKELSNRLGADYGRHELNQITSAAQALGELASSGKSERHIQRTAMAAKGFQESLQRTRQALAEREKGGLKALSEARKEKLNLTSDKSFLAIVTAFQNAPDRRSRLEWLKQATDEGDGRTLAALIEAPTFTTGIDRETLEKHLELAEQTHAPDLAERRAKFDADRDVINSALEIGERVASRAVDLESIAAAERADKAEEQLNQATS